MSVEIAWKQNILVTDFHLLKSLLVVFGFGSQAFVCGFSRQNINSVGLSPLNLKMFLQAWIWKVINTFDVLWYIRCHFGCPLMIKRTSKYNNHYSPQRAERPRGVGTPNSVCLFVYKVWCLVYKRNSKVGQSRRA